MEKIQLKIVIFTTIKIHSIMHRHVIEMTPINVNKKQVLDSANEFG